MIFIALLLASISVVYGEEILSTCSKKVEPLGCYQDLAYSKDRTLQEQLSWGHQLHKEVGKREGNYKYSDHVNNRCAEAASKKGYSIIGIQYYGSECWSGPDGLSRYNMEGVSKTCINEKSETLGNATSCSIATGTNWENFAYKIAPTGSTGCDTHYEPVGGYHDSLVEPRPLKYYIQNEKDPTAPGWNGKVIDWVNWDTYFPQMICRCAKAAEKHGYDLFGIQFWGECWSGNSKEVLTYSRDGPSTQCAGKDFKQCPCNSYECVGKKGANYVYKLTHAAS